MARYDMNRDLGTCKYSLVHSAFPFVLASSRVPLSQLQRLPVMACGRPLLKYDHCLESASDYLPLFADFSPKSAGTGVAT